MYIENQITKNMDSENFYNESIKIKIEKNRKEIERFLNVDLPLDIVYFNIRILSASNEKLIKKLNAKN